MVCTAYCFVVGMQGVNGMHRLLFHCWDARRKWYVPLTVSLLGCKA